MFHLLFAFKLIHVIHVCFGYCGIWSKANVIRADSSLKFVSCILWIIKPSCCCQIIITNNSIVHRCCQKCSEQPELQTKEHLGYFYILHQQRWGFHPCLVSHNKHFSFLMWSQDYISIIVCVWIFHVGPLLVLVVVSFLSSDPQRSDRWLPVMSHESFSSHQTGLISLLVHAQDGDQTEIKIEKRGKKEVKI